MASPLSLALPSSMLLLFISIFFLAPARNASCAAARTRNHSSRLVINHIYTSATSTKEITSDIIARDASRAKFMANKFILIQGQEKAGVNEPMLTQPNSGIYTVSVGLGTPVMEFSLVIDTGSDLSWVPCAPCESTDCKKVFNPESSYSYQCVICTAPQCTMLESYGGAEGGCSGGHCMYLVTYGDGSFSNGTLSVETLTPGNYKVFEYVFGCGYRNEGFEYDVGMEGVLALGKAALGFPAQTSTLFNSTFIYCLPYLNNAYTTGFIEFGVSASIDNPYTTALISQPQYPSFYFVGLKEISVNSERIQVRNNNSLGFIMDSGTFFSYLESVFYDNLRDVFVEQMKYMCGLLPLVNTSVCLLDTCYYVGSGVNCSFPQLNLYFDDMTDAFLLPFSNIMYEADDGVLCLAFAPLTVGSNLSGIIGSYQQQGIGINYDIPASKIGFFPSMC